MKKGELADALLSRLERILGPVIFDALIEEMANNDFIAVDIRTVIIERPALFERAFLDIVGEAGMTILRITLDQLINEYQISSPSKLNLAMCVQTLEP